MAEKQTEKATISKKSDVEAFIERKLNTLNAISRDSGRSGKAERAMTRIIAKNRKGGMA